MPLKWFICPDGNRIEPQACLTEGGCRMGDRCATRSYLHMARSERPWTGKPSTTQLISGTMQAFLKLTKDYAVSPDKRAFMINGTNGHRNLEGYDDEYSILEEKFTDGDETGIADVYEQEKNYGILTDHKISGSYKVAKALGWYITEEPTGEFFKSGARRGQEKMRKILRRDPARADVEDWEWQLNKYRIEFEKRGFPVHEIRIQCIVRDGNTFVARSRGVFRNVYYFKIKKLDDKVVLDYFKAKREALAKALEQGFWTDPCTAKENWDGLKCASYCEVAEHCSLGKYLKREKENDEMAIKNLSDIRRLPRLGKIRLGIKKKTASGAEYPAEVDYFILDPQTPSELENQKLIDEFHQLYGEQPKQIKIMLPVADTELYFPQFYKRYGRSTSLQCKGDGETATCATKEFTQGLEILGGEEMGQFKVRCLGRECIYFKNRQCAMVGSIQVLLPDLPGAGVWQIDTGSFNSIVSLNSGIEYVKALCGRAHMLPLTLERREIETAHDGKKTKHYALQINMDFRLNDLQKFAQIDSTKILLELPAPDPEVADIVFQENAPEIEAIAGPVAPPAPAPSTPATPPPPAAPPVSAPAPAAERQAPPLFMDPPQRAETEVMITRDQKNAIPMMAKKLGWTGARVLEEIRKVGYKNAETMTMEAAAKLIRQMNEAMKNREVNEAPLD